MRFGHLIIRTMNFFRLMRRAGNFGLGRESCKRIEGISYAESLFSEAVGRLYPRDGDESQESSLHLCMGNLERVRQRNFVRQRLLYKQYRQLKELDRTRPRTSASNKHKKISAWIYRRLYLSICIRSGIAIRMRRRWTAYRI